MPSGPSDRSGRGTGRSAGAGKDEPARPKERQLTFADLFKEEPEPTPQTDVETKGGTPKASPKPEPEAAAAEQVETVPEASSPRAHVAPVDVTYPTKILPVEQDVGGQRHLASEVERIPATMEAAKEAFGLSYLDTSKVDFHEGAVLAAQNHFGRARNTLLVVPPGASQFAAPVLWLHRTLARDERAIVIVGSRKEASTLAQLLKESASAKKGSIKNLTGPSQTEDTRVTALADPKTKFVFSLRVVRLASRKKLTQRDFP